MQTTGLRRLLEVRAAVTRKVRYRMGRAEVMYNTVRNRVRSWRAVVPTDSAADGSDVW